MCVANMKQMSQKVENEEKPNFVINVDFLFPGNLVSLSVITRASLDFKTSFLRLVELVIFTILNNRL